MFIHALEARTVVSFDCFYVLGMVRLLRFRHAAAQLKDQDYHTKKKE